jgi:hypothetical protein
MIQRIQSLYLLFIVVFMASMYTIPSAVFDDGSFNISNLVLRGIVKQSAEGPVLIQTNNLFMILTAISFIISLTAIFLYKNRPLQIKTCWVLIISLSILFLYTVVTILMIKSSGRYAIVNFGKGAALPLISVLPAFMAIRAIKKDDDLVKSIDRLR